jgi:Ca2+-binding RTX toxin-like protein
MTTINLNLSTTLQQTLSNAGTGTYVYAFAFGATTSGGDIGLVDSIEMVANGALTSTTSLNVTAGQFYSGDIYVVIQQGGDGNLLTEITEVGQVAELSQSKNYSYQLFEITLSNNSEDQGDISALNTFGFTSAFEVVYQSGSVTRSFNSSALDIFNTFPTAVTNYNNNAFPHPQMLATGPATANDQVPWAGSDWQSYIDALKSPDNAGVLSEIEIVYGFGGSGTLSHYTMEYVAKDQYGEDYFWLVPDTSYGANNTDWLQITAEELVQNVYVQTGQLTYYQGGKDATPQQYSSFTPNNADGGVAMVLVAGFDAGFWGGVGTSPNALVTESINFSKFYNWSVNYAYDAILLDGVGAATYDNSLLWFGGGQFYDPWAQQFVANSNVYGYSYSDLVSLGGINPQVDMYDPATSANVETINITLYDTGETPTGFLKSDGGYIAPTAQSGLYEDSLTATTNQLNFAFNFSVGSTVYAPNSQTAIKFKIYAPSSPQADGNGFIVLDVAATGGTNGDWCYYSIVNNAGTWALQFDNTTGASGAGIFNIANLPATADGSPSWYQLVFGEGDSQSTYNIYAETDASTGTFTNVVVDHGVDVTEFSSSNYGLDFAPGGQMLYSIANFAAPPVGSPSSVGSTIYGTNRTNFVNALQSVGAQAGPTDGADTIYGRGGRDYLSGLAGNDIIDGGAGIDMLRGNEGDDILLVRGNEGIYDYFHGGADTDTLRFIGAGAVTLNGFKAGAGSIEILEGNGRGLLGTAQMDVFDLSALQALHNLPFIDAGRGDDIVTGSNFADDLRGGAGDDILEGGDGNDTLDGGGGVDALDGGDGDDTLQVRGREGVNDTFDGGTGTDTLQLLGTVTLAGFDATASSIEILQGNGRALHGTNQADVFDLSGLTAAPTGLRFIDAKGGDDTLIGSDFDDALRGGAGNDILDGRGGNDRLNGGSGNNTFVFGDGYDSDTVVGYKASKDTFDLQAVSGVTDFGDLTLTQIAPRIVLIDFDGVAGGDTLTIQGTTVAILTANQGDFLLS